MFWGEVELEPELRDWYLTLDDDEQGRVDFHIDRHQVERARRAMQRCSAEAHTAEDDDD